MAQVKRRRVECRPLLKVTPFENWRSRVLSDGMLVPQLITSDARTVQVYVQLKTASMKLLVGFQSQMKKVVNDIYPEAEMSVGGVPAVQTDLGLLLDKELKNFILLTILACAVTLIFTFDSISTVFIPLFLTAFANLMVFAMMAWCALPFTILSATIPILVFITVVSLSVHFFCVSMRRQGIGPTAHVTSC